MSKKDNTKAESGNNSANEREQRITGLTTRLSEVFEQASNLAEKDPAKKSMLVRVDDLENRVEFWQNYLESIRQELRTWDEEVDRIESQLSGLEKAFAAKVDELDHPRLPSSWRDITQKVIYQTQDGRLVKFGKRQIKVAKRIDHQNAHLEAIEKGRVASKHEEGLVPSQESGFELKSKVMGRYASHHRFHAYYDGNVLFFPGKHTND